MLPLERVTHVLSFQSRYRRPEAYQLLEPWSCERLGSVPSTPSAKRERSVTDIGDYVVCIIYDSI